MDAEERRDWVSIHNDKALLADGFEDAFIGMAERRGQPTLAVYDAEKCIAILVERDQMSDEDAREYFYFNVAGAWCGEHAPLFLWRAP
jgi:hypothetical protein